MADNKRKKNRNQRYLTDQENPSIPKQSRKRWRETGTPSSLYDGNLNHNSRLDLAFSDTEAGPSQSISTTTPELVENEVDSEPVIGDLNLENVSATSYDDFHFLPDPVGANQVDSSEVENDRIQPSDNQDGAGSANYYKDMPYIPDADDFIRDGSYVTKGQAIVTLISFILRHHLTGAAVEDLLEILEILSPGCLPSSKYLLTKGIGLQDNAFEAHLFCPVCDLYLDKYTHCENLDSCHSCNTALNRDQCLKDGNFYLYIPIESQLKEILKRNSLIKKSDFVVKENLVSAFSGRMIKELYHRGEISDDDITLIWNCDGAPVFRSSKRSIWPLQACLNEIPHDSKENCLLIGLWFAKEKPWSHCYLKPFVEELKHLGTVGMDWINNNNEFVHSRVFSLCASCDSCARPMFRNTTQFNGQFGCDWCLQEGEVIDRGDGFSRIYCLQDYGCNNRDNIKFMDDALACSESNPRNGVKGISPLLFLPLFDIVRGFVPDYLHCILLGVVRTFTGLWFDSRNHLQAWYIGRNLSEISNQLANMKIPSNISRLPRSLTERKFWKGSEWKSFLLYYSLFVLSGKLPQNYLNHWFLLVYSVNLLLQDEITMSDVDVAETALLDFVRNVPVLYGREYCTFNVHQLLHIPDAVRDWGPLWVFSCFRFEGNIGQILSLVRGTKCVANQICKTFLMQSMLPRLHHHYFTVCDLRLDSLLDRLMCSGRYVRKKSHCIDDVHLYGSSLTRVLGTAEVLAFSRLYGNDPHKTTYKIYNRLAINSLYLTSVDHKVSNRHSDDTLQLNNYVICVLLRCAVGKFFCNCDRECECEEKVLLFVNKIDISNDRPLFFNRELNISSNKFLVSGHRNLETVCVEPSNVYRKCFRQKSDKYFIIPLPTIKESDK